VEKANHNITTLCRVLEVSTSGFYAWTARPLSRHATDDAFLGVVIEAIHAASRGTYGVPRVHAELALGHGIGCSRKRVARLMAARRLRGCGRRRRRGFTRPGKARAPDLVGRRFDHSAPNRLWMTDLTYVPTATGFSYLAAVLDAYSRAVVGWALGARPGADVAIAALQAAIAQRNPAPGLIVHSDRGTQFTSAGFAQLCARIGARRSMGRVGSCYDNAVAESFFATVERELLDQVRLADRDHAGVAIDDFIEVFYNRRRRHSHLGYLSPLDYERRNAPQSPPETVH
jgi:putative transposase